MTAKAPPAPTQREDIVLVDQLYTLDDAAAFFGFSSRTWLQKQIDAGLLEYVDLNPGGKRPDKRVRASSLNKLIQSLTFKEAA